MKELEHCWLPNHFYVMIIYNLVILFLKLQTFSLLTQLWQCASSLQFVTNKTRSTDKEDFFLFSFFCEVVGI